MRATGYLGIQPRTLTLALVLSCFVANVDVFGQSAFESRTTADVDYIKQIEERAEKLKADKEWIKAEREVRKLVFALPRNKSYQKEIKSLRKEVAKYAVGIATAEGTSDVDAVRYMKLAFDYDRKNRDANSYLKKAGFKKDGNAGWRTKAEIAEAKAKDKVQEEQRARELRVAGKTHVIRDSEFRFFTDVKPNNPKLQQMIAASKATCRTFWGAMSAFDLSYPVEGLDVVIFAKEEDYRRMTMSADTAGVYIPSKSACFFYLSGGSEDFPTLVHEMTHQLMHKVAKIWGISDAFNEGLAEYYGYGKLKNSFSKLVLGQPNGQYIRSIQDHLFKRSGGDFVYLPFSRFLHQDSDNYDFYQQAWCFYHFLMHSKDVRHRLVIFDYLYSNKAVDADLAPVLQRYGLSEGKLESQFKDYWRAFKG